MSVRLWGGGLAGAGEHPARDVGGEDVRQIADGGEHGARHLGDLGHDLLAHVDHALELVVGAFGEGTPAVHDHDAGADPLDLLHVMARVDHRGALVAQPADAVEDGVPALGVDGHRGLVKEDELGLVGDAAGDVQAPREAARELLWAETLEVAEAHELDRLVDESPAPRAVVDVEAAEVVDVLADGELLEDGHLLRHHADAALEVVASGSHRLSEELDLALVVGEQLQDAVDGGRLAASVGAQQAEDLALGDAQVEVVERKKVAVALDEVLDAYDVGHVRSFPARRGAPFAGCSMLVPSYGGQEGRRK